jgi:hypothetical protein
MRKELSGKVRKVEAIPKVVEAAVMEAKTPEEMVDVIGAVKGAERKYKPIISGAAAEHAPSAGGFIRGEKHNVETKRQASRSYHTNNLLTKAYAEGYSIQDLIDAGVMEIKWRWTELERFSRTRGVDLDVVEREVNSLDKKEKADVGESWGDGYPKWS